jgi:hypothetical protein
MQVCFRAPEGKALAGITANGRDTPIVGRNKDAALINTGGQRRFEVVATLG